jgi:hypothetical protein
MKEGNGTLLDNTCLMFLSNMWIGRKHDNFRLPLVLAGGLGGTLETGRTLNYLDASEDSRSNDMRWTLCSAQFSSTSVSRPRCWLQISLRAWAWIASLWFRQA